MSEELQPGQLVRVSGETCKICGSNHKPAGALAYDVETPDGGHKMVFASQIAEVITEAPEVEAGGETEEEKAEREAAEAAQIAADAAALAADLDVAAQVEADKAVIEALEKAHEAGEHADAAVETCPVCQAEADASAELAAGSPS